MARIVDPVLIADIISNLNVQGPLAPFEVGETAIPVFDIGKNLSPDVVTTLAGFQGVRPGTISNKDYLTVGPPRVNSAEEADGGIVNGPVATTVLADTGQLVAGDWLVWFYITGSTAEAQLRFQRRNAANSGNVTQQSLIFTEPGGPIISTPFIMDVVTDERFRIEVAANVTGLIATTIFHANVSASLADI